MIANLKVWACLTVALAGCAMGPGTPQMEEARITMAKPITFVPEEGKAGIYVIRESAVVGGAVQWQAYLDGEELGMLFPKQFLYVEVPPGEHSLGVIVNSGMTVHATAGSNQFFLVTGKSIVSSPSGNLTKISEGRGRGYVVEFARLER